MVFEIDLSRTPIRRGLRDRGGDSNKTWIFRIRRSSPADINVIHWRNEKDIHSCTNSVVNLAGHYCGIRAPGAVRVMTHRDPNEELPRWQTISKGNCVTYPTHTGLLLNFQQILVCLVFANVTVVVGS